MTIWALIEVTVFILFAVAMMVMWSRLRRPPQDDPRLSRGLQLLQSKISVLEDLSDRTETQVNQLMSLLEQKARLVQQKIQDAETQILAIEQSMQKSLEVAQIFQDKIPHEEIIERKNTVKYVQAARLAHQGASLEEIASQVDLPRSEIELIAKVNRDQLMFSEQQLPEWMKGTASEAEVPSIEMNNKSGPERTTQISLESLFQTPQLDLAAVRKLDEDFRKTVTDYNTALEESEKPSALLKTTQAITEKLADRAQSVLGAAAESLQKTVRETRVVPSSYLKTELKVHRDETKTVSSDSVKKVLFPRLDADEPLR